MFEYIYDWLWNYACYIIWITALLHILPENSYQKYIRFCSGLILVILLTTPIFRILGMDVSIDEIYQTKEYQKVINEIKQMESELLEKEDDIWKEDIE